MLYTSIFTHQVLMGNYCSCGNCMSDFEQLVKAVAPENSQLVLITKKCMSVLIDAIFQEIS